jgi:hypothetical protein
LGYFAANLRELWGRFSKIALVLFAVFIGLVVLFGTVFDPPEAHPVAEIVPGSLTPARIENGFLIYSNSVRINRMCPAAIVTTARKLGGNQAPGISVLRRAAVLLEPGLYEDVKIRQQLPGFTSGDWEFTVTRDSRCPDGRVVDYYFTLQARVP